MPFKSDKQKAFLAINKPDVFKRFQADTPKKSSGKALKRKNKPSKKLYG